MKDRRSYSYGQLGGHDAVRVSVRLPADLVQRVDALAEDSGERRSSLVRAWIEEGLARDERKRERDAE